MKQTADFIIVGAGIVGLAIARELKLRHPECHVIVLEKEREIGLHSSGRNSGVLHSGIYYPENSRKAKVCAAGAQEMAEYCAQHRLPIARLGKVILPVRADDDKQLELLLARAKSNGARAELLNTQQLHELEPAAHSITGKALYSPDTAVIDPKLVLGHLAATLQQQGVEIRYGCSFDEVLVERSTIVSNGAVWHYGRLFNTAGLHADRVARAFGIGRQYTILPFKGIYYRLSEAADFAVRHLIYPVPDLRVPFLGVHFTKSINGHIYLGPTAVPAFGRENYAGWQGVEVDELVHIIFNLCKQYARNTQGFRQFATEEGLRFFKPHFAAAAKALVPKLQVKHLISSQKVGLRAQLLDLKKQELVMDFVIEHGKNSTHVLNAVSPAFTSAFSFARLVLNETGVA
ncbi:MAG: L-2-hydroxyglutarate oxidase [Cyanobacteria bacterium NC_groundwater_1444_Ag_S-0.65um_54_12]|nr:L-2-hydroxyglutarate oxidase [Cyanobacteria bacterium NC_groundwater_1444_Ag_S-0.65um_54_12]